MGIVLESADFLHSKSQLITKSYMNMEGIDLFVKIFSQGAMTRNFRSLEVGEASSLHLKDNYHEFPTLQIYSR